MVRSSSKIFLFIFVIMTLLLASCGGGANNQGTQEAPGTANTEAAPTSETGAATATTEATTAPTTEATTAATTEATTAATTEATTAATTEATTAAGGVLGLSYKADIDDDRESPSFEIIGRLQAAGAEVAYCDPYIPVARPGREHDLRLSSVPCTAEAFARYDVLVVSTAHSDFKDEQLYSLAKLVVDTRNLMAPLGLGGPGARGPEVFRA